MVENLSKTIDGVKILDNISFTLGREDKVALVGGNEQAKTVLFKSLMGDPYYNKNLTLSKWNYSLRA